LKDDFNLYYVDFPGTNNIPYEKKTFKELSHELSKKISSIEGDKISLGHSFGGFFAAELLLKGEVSSLITLSTPFSAKTLESVGTQYSKNKTPQLLTAEDEWNKNPSNETFRRWLSSYGKLYFYKKESKYSLINDLCSFEFFINNRSDAMSMEEMLPQLKIINAKKIFIAGADDLLVSANLIREEATRSDSTFVLVEQASHFLTEDNPEKIRKILKKNL
jgi:pimeloyl-ACP methyl ester carboxylesterase